MSKRDREKVIRTGEETFGRFPPEIEIPTVPLSRWWVLRHFIPVAFRRRWLAKKQAVRSGFHCRGAPLYADGGDRHRHRRAVVPRGHRRPRAGHSRRRRLWRCHDAPAYRRPGTGQWRAGDCRDPRVDLNFDVDTFSIARGLLRGMESTPTSLFLALGEV